MPLMIAGSSSCLNCLKVLSREEEKKEVSLRKSSLASAAGEELLVEEVAREGVASKRDFFSPTTLEARNKATVANTFVF